MINASQALSTLPPGLRDVLLEEYRSIVQNYFEHRWSPAELSGGKFCEVVYTILDGHARGKYAPTPSKPRDMVSACRALESNSHVPRSFQILIPRLLPALYEIRNNRGVGHVGGDVDPNHMDAVAVLSISNWIMGELIRVLHGLSLDEAQRLVDAIAERRVPLVWQGEGVKRVLDPELPLKEQILLLLASSGTPVTTSDLMNWTGYKRKPYFFRLLRRMHQDRLVELSADETRVEVLPPGAQAAERMVADRSEHAA